MTETAVKESSTEESVQEQPRSFADTPYATLERVTPEQMELKARNLRLRYDKDDAPVNPVAIAQGLGIDVLTAKFQKDHVSGIITKEGRKSTLYVRDEMPLVKKKWVIGHLIGHHQLHLQGKDGNWMDSMETLFWFDPTTHEKALEEAEANRFAAALLVPLDALLYVWNYADTTMQVAKELYVPLAAVEYRLKRFGLR